MSTVHEPFGNACESENTSEWVAVSRDGNITEVIDSYSLCNGLNGSLVGVLLNVTTVLFSYGIVNL